MRGLVVTKRYLCPKHKEKTPSAVVYGDGFFCFGCGARGPASELGLPPGERIEITYKEDIAESIARIEALPRKLIRGFMLPYNDRGYFLVYPDRAYYKLRLGVGDDAGNKYRGPTGHKKPKFVAHKSGNLRRLVLVEGEFNALSLAALELPWDVVSPGAAGDFFSKSRASDLQEYAKYERVDIVVDDDGAGFQAAIECASQLKVLGCENVKAHFVKRDFNDIYDKDGKEALKEVAKALGLYPGL